MRILCDFLTIIGLLAKQDGIYSHTPTSALFLDPRSPALAAFDGALHGPRRNASTYDQLTEIVRSGRTVLPGEGRSNRTTPCGWISPTAWLP